MEGVDPETVAEFQQIMKDMVAEVEANPTVVSVPTCSYSRSVHWQKMGLACENVSKECTKMAVAFSKGTVPPISDIQILIKDIFKAVDILTSWFKVWPLSEGKVLQRLLHTHLTCIVYSVCDFLKHANNPNPPEYKIGDITIGTVWENCERFHILPKDNTTAAKERIESSTDLITDALNELKNDIKAYDDRSKTDDTHNEDDDDDDDDSDDEDDDDDDEDEDEWCDADRPLLTPCCALLLASRGLSKKSCAALNKHIENAVTDELCDHIDKLSPCVDEFVMAVHPPINRTVLLEKAVSLKNVVSDTLTFCRSSSLGTKTENKKWLDLIQNGIDHNFSKLSQLAVEI